MTKSVLDKAQNHFKTIIDSELKSYKCEEWDSTIYYKPTLTWKEQSMILDAGQKSSADAIIQTLLIRALNKDGSKMFSKADKLILENDVDPDIIVKVVGAINLGSSKLDEEDLEKK